jgi:hypothetical protein
VAKIRGHEMGACIRQTQVLEDFFTHLLVLNHADAEIILPKSLRNDLEGLYIVPIKTPD